MALASKEWRHLLLLTAIVAALPLLIFPQTLGLNLKLSFVVYIVVELIYFYFVFRLLNPGSVNTRAVAGMLLSLCGRLLLSAAFWLYLMGFAAVQPGAAFGQAFFFYKPALMLFSLAAPVIFNSAVSLLTANLQAPRKPTRPAALRVSRVATSPGGQPRAATSPRATVSSRESESFGLGFEGAVRHVGEYSGVLCALLIDSEGLPLASFDRNDEDPEMWAGLALKLTDDLRRTLTKVGSDDLNWLEFQYDGKRCHLLPVRDMWLMSIANAAADELEKIRMQQAAAMVNRHHEDKYQSQAQTLTENSYAGSTVGA
jgi:predicted regulator of Ras-like GTPase activity (Roadblock/LC7/MglB family)